MSSLIINYGLCIAITTTLSYWIYKFLYSFFPCTNLNELLVGSTIYANYNKTIDFAIFFIYLGLFFMIFPLIQKFIPKFHIKDFLKDFKPYKADGNKQILSVLLTLCSFMYFLLYPNDGNTYPVVLFVVILLVVLTNVDIYFKVFTKDKSISPLTIAPLFLFFFGASYNYGIVSIDDYHFGEKFSTFYLYNVHNFEIFKDIILVHGFNDIFSGWVGLNVFGENSLYAYYLADTFISNLTLLLSFFLGYFVFSSSPILMSGIFVSVFSYFNVYFLITLAMLKKELLEKPFKWLQIYIILAFLLPAFWTQIGIFVILAIFPVALYMLIKLFKINQWRKIFYLILLFTMFSIFFKSYILNGFDYYMSNNYLSSANGFPEFKVHQIWSNFIKLFALLSVPCFVIEFVKAYKNKQIQLSFIYAFALLLPLLGLIYELTRIDLIMFSRIRFISIAYITILLPFIFTITKSIWLKYTKYVFTFLLIGLIIINFKTLDRWDKKPIADKNPIEIIGNLKLEVKNQERIESLKKIVDKYSAKDDYILDLTNRGLNYFYLERKIPYKFISFFNFTSKKQENSALESLEQNPPKIILISTNNIQHDKIYPSLRINSIYKWILSNNYKIFEDSGNVFLIKSKKKVKYSKKELEILDKILANNDLKKLPESWGNSIETLNLKEGKDLMYFEIEATEPANFIAKMKNSSSELKFNTGEDAKILLPLDNFPSWVLNPDKVTISTDKFVKITNIKYYKRF